MLGVADDPGMHSSQNEQDSRNYAIGAKVPMLEPSDSQECLDFAKTAYELSEQFDTPVVLRLTTRISHSRSLCELSDRKELELKPYVKNPQKNVMLPAYARPRHVFVEERMQKLIAWAESAAINRVEMHSTKIGVITSGASYQYAHEALGDGASYLKLGMAERTNFKAYCVYSAAISLLVYPISGHWIWGGGWLSALGFHDFAGSTCVHMVGGAIACLGAALLGPRIGKYDKNGKPHELRQGSRNLLQGELRI